MDKPFAAYSGTEPYVFVCYAHKDAGVVYPDLTLLSRNGLNVWYDEGIPAGSAWRAEIAAAIKGAKKLLFFISKASLNSQHCLREVDYALSHDIEIVPVYVDDADLPAGLDLELNRVQALFRSTDAMYAQHLVGALQGRPHIAQQRRLTTKRNRYVGLALLALALGALSLLYGMQRDATNAREPSSRLAMAGPNAFDHYLEGLTLMKRWDKDDNLDRAIGLFQEAAKQDPTFALAFARLAEGLRVRYMLTKDEQWLTEATNNANEAVRLDAGLAPVQVALGRVYATRGNNDLAFAALQRALTIDANDAEAHQAIAVVYLRLGRLQEAEASYQKALALDGENPTTLNAYANFLFGQSRFEDAAVQWQAMVRIAPDHYAALVNLGAALNETGKVPEAITMYLRALKLRPTYMVYSNLGTVYSRGKRYPEAIDAFRKALEIDDTQWIAWGNLAQVYAWSDGKDQAQTAATFARAIELAESARQKSPRDPFVHSDLALYYAKTEQPVLALQRLETAITLAPDSGEIQAAAAEAYEQLGQRDQAIAFAGKAMKLGFSRQRLQRNPAFSGLLTDSRMQAVP